MSEQQSPDTNKIVGAIAPTTEELEKIGEEQDINLKKDEINLNVVQNKKDGVPPYAVPYWRRNRSKKPNNST